MAERWFPDAYVIALIALLAISIAALSIGAGPSAIVMAIGDGYWKLNNFTYQMAMVVITGFAVASCGPVKRGVKALARIPTTERGAVAFIILVSVIANAIHWGFGLMFSVFLVMACTARKELHLDVRAAAAAGFAGNCASMMGLSSSAALLHATPASLPPELLKISGVIPLGDTIFLWQNGVAILVMTVVAMFVAWATVPRGAAARTASDLGLNPGKMFEESHDEQHAAVESRPGDSFANSPLLTIAVGGLMIVWIVMKMMQIGIGATISSLNNYLFISLTVAFLMHWRIKSFLSAIASSVPAVGGILLQFPIYAAVASVLMLAQNAEGHTVSHYLGQFFAQNVTREMMPPVVGVYSIVVGLFIPSAGAKWVVEAPYILDAANQLQSHLGWLINTYGGAETLANLLNPFWMLPMLGLMKLRVRSVVGFTFMYFVFLVPVMLCTFWLLGLTLEYHPPVMP
ncbi:hypothetical protein Tamer19_36920 [Cupriavidus sp. TA19]|nr:hypothetical protein Tamer19_36920 [Cupriavidus sp. TA19]